MGICPWCGQAQGTGSMNGFWYHPLGKEGVWSTHTGMVEQRELGYPGLEPFEQFGTALDPPMKGNGHHDTHIRQWPKVRAKPISQRLLMHGREVHYPKVRENKMFVISFERNDISCQ